MVTPQEAVDTVFEKESINERLHAMHGSANTDVQHDATGAVGGMQWTNPSKGLVDRALKTWSAKKMRADNTSVVTVILYPPGGQSKDEEPASVDTGAAGDLMPENSPQKHCEYLIEEIESFEDNASSYHQVAKKYTPPEAYRNFNYYEDEMEVEDEEEDVDIRGCAADNAELEMDPLMEKYNKLGFNYWLNNDRHKYETEAVLMQQHQTIVSNDTSSCNYYENSRHENRKRQHKRKYQNAKRSNLPVMNADDLEDTDEDAADDESNQASSSGCLFNAPSHNVDYQYENSNCAASNSSWSHMQTSFEESYNSLMLSDQIHGSQHSSPSNSNSNSASCQSISGSSMHEILQEQQLYQQQCMSEEEGYSLTKLETRREQQRCSGAVQTFKIFQQYQNGNSASSNTQHEAETTNDSSSSSSQANYWEAAARYSGSIPKYMSYQQPSTECTESNSSSFELNSLLQQERQEEEQVALERAQMDNNFESSFSNNSLDDTISNAAELDDEDNCVVAEYLESVEIIRDVSVQINEISSSSSTCEIEAADLSPSEEIDLMPPTVKNSKIVVVEEKIEKIEILHPKPELVIEAVSTHASSSFSQRNNSSSCSSLKSCLRSSYNPKPSSSTCLPLRRSQNLYANVPNENQRRSLSKCNSSSNGSSSNNSASCGRQLRSADFGKRTLRTRNSLTKDLKAKSTLKRSSSSSQFLRKTASSMLTPSSSDAQVSRDLLQTAKRISRNDKLVENMSNSHHRSHAIHLRSRLVAAVPLEENSASSQNAERQLRSKSSSCIAAPKDISSFSKSTRFQSNSSSSLTAPPPSPKLINGAAAVAAATRARSLLNAKHAGVVQAVFSNKRSTLRSGGVSNSAGSRSNSSTGAHAAPIVASASQGTFTRSRVAKKLKQ